MKKTVLIEVLQGVEGKILVIESTRVAGPKPWGGGRTILKWEVEVDEIRLALAFRGHEPRGGSK